MNGARFFWENVQAIIKFRNLRQEWVATQAGIRFGTFHGWISKDIFPRADEAVRIAAVLDTSVETLVSGKSAALKKTNISYHLSVIREHLKALEMDISPFLLKRTKEQTANETTRL
jgi:transcriptional regulator with XRE-family HTH domain